MELIDVVNKLVGPIGPVADSHNDAVRLENLKELCKLADKILFNIHAVARDSESKQDSVNKLGEYARNFLTDVNDSYL